MWVGLADDFGIVEYVEENLIQDIPRSVAPARESDETVGLTFITLFTTLALIGMWVAVIALTLPHTSR